MLLPFGTSMNISNVNAITEADKIIRKTSA